MKKRYQTEEELRAAVEKQMGQALSDEVWATNYQDRHPSFDVADVKDFVDMLRKAGVEPQGSNPPRAVSVRGEAAARMLESAIREDRLRIFGSEKPPCSNLPEMDEYLREKAKADLLSYKDIMEQLATGVALSYPLRSGGVTYIAVREGTRLHDLWKCVIQRARELGCDESEATAFYLTGAIPSLTPITYSYTLTSLVDKKYYGEITIRIREPVPEDEVLKVYKKARRRAWGSKRAPKPLVERDAALNRFARQWASTVGKKSVGGKWAAMRAEWDRQYPKWKFEYWQAFRMALQRATAKIYPPPP